MKYLEYGFRFFKKWWGLNILLAAEIVVTLLILNLCLGRTNMQYQSVHLFSDLTGCKGVYYTPRSKFEYLPDDHAENPQKTKTDFDSLTGVDEIASIQKMSFINEDGKVIDAIVYPEYLIDKMPTFFQPDIWKGMKNPAEGTVPAVVLDGLYSSQCHSGNYTIAGSERAGESLQICTMEILGTAKTGNKYLSFSKSSDNLSCLQLFNTHNDRFAEAPLLFTVQSAVEPYSQYIYWTMDNKLIFFDQDITQDAYRANIEELKKTGIVASFEEIYQEGIATVQSDMSSLLAVTLCFLAIAVIGLISLIILNTLRHLPAFSVYFICGCRWNHCLLIILSYLLYIGVLVVVGSGIVWGVLLLQDSLFEMQLLLALNNVWASLLMLASIAVLAVLPAFVALKVKSPIQILQAKDR